MTTIEKGVVITLVVVVVVLAFFVGRIDAGIECYYIIENMEKAAEVDL